MKLNMDILKVFSARAMSLLAFILVTLLVGTMFNVKLGPEPFTDLLNLYPYRLKICTDKCKRYIAELSLLRDNSANRR